MDRLNQIKHLLHEAIWGYLRPYWFIHIPLAIAVVMGVGVETCVPLTIRFLIDSALIPHDPQQLIKGLVTMGRIF